MSWGERSCLKPCRVPDKCTMANCNVDCVGYIWDGETKPDSTSKVDLVGIADTKIHFKPKKKKKTKCTFSKYF